MRAERDRVGSGAEDQRAAKFRAAIEAALTGAGLAADCLRIRQRGIGAADVSFTLRRPATRAKGQPWDADGDADRLVARAVMALMPDYAVERVGTGRMTVLTVSALATAVCS